MAKKIELTQGYQVVVDDEDYESLATHNWYPYKSQCGIVYAVTSHSVRMHRVIMGLHKGDKKLIDHRNDNGLDNQKSNLRICTYRQNVQNKRKQKAIQSGHKGVSWNTSNKKWRSRIYANGKSVHLGLFTDVIEAAKTYDQAATRYFGEFARQNFPAQGA